MFSMKLLLFPLFVLSLLILCQGVCVSAAVVLKVFVWVALMLLLSVVMIVLLALKLLIIVGILLFVVWTVAAAVVLGLYVQDALPLDLFV